VHYAEDQRPEGSRWFLFQIWVSADDEQQTERIIDRLNPKLKPKRPANFSGWWTEIEPTRLSKTHKDHRWSFAVYRESCSQRDDGLNYIAFLFRNQVRSIFGIQEWLGKDVIIKNGDLQKLAHRVVTDREFRNGLVSDDSDLPPLWRKR
jgi:hypothetical protein